MPSFLIVACSGLVISNPVFIIALQSEMKTGLLISFLIISGSAASFFHILHILCLSQYGLPGISIKIGEINMGNNMELDYEMFCYQCEQTANQKGCTKLGVCGKTPEVANLQDLLIFQIKGISCYARPLIEKGTPMDKSVVSFIEKNFGLTQALPVSPRFTPPTIFRRPKPRCCATRPSPVSCMTSRSIRTSGPCVRPFSTDSKASAPTGIRRESSAITAMRRMISIFSPWKPSRTTGCRSRN